LFWLDLVLDAVLIVLDPLLQLKVLTSQVLIKSRFFLDRSDLAWNLPSLETTAASTTADAVCYFSDKWEYLKKGQLG
jgi:hypothetical protein